MMREFAFLRAAPQFRANFNVAPSQTVPAIRAIAGKPEGALLRWGLVPFFAKGKPGKYSTFNARAEGLASSASFRGPWRQGQRCIVPALGFYEWHTCADGSKQPYYIRLKDQAIFGFAGLWDRSRLDDGSILESCTIITLPANAMMAEIHNSKARMPAILPRTMHEVWLFGVPEAAGAALRAYPQESMLAYRVGTRVNSPKNNDEALLDPVPTARD